MVSGLLVFYRWPQGTDLACAPDCVQRVLVVEAVQQSMAYEIFCVRVGRQQQRQQEGTAGVPMPVEDVRLAHKSTSFMLTHVTIEDVALVELMERSFEERYLPCRYDPTSRLHHARSTVAWLPGFPDPVGLPHPASGEVVTLTTLIDSGLPFALDLLRCMLGCAEFLTPALHHAKKIKHQHEKSLEELRRAVQCVESQGASGATCALVRVQEPTRLVSEYVSGSAAVPDRVAPFADVISQTGRLKRLESLRPGLGNPQQHTGFAVRLVLQHWENTTVDTLMNGRAVWPRSGRMRLSADSKKRKSAGTKIIFHLDGTNRPEDVTTDETAKASAMWVASFNDVVCWLRLSQKPRNGESLVLLGRVVFVSGLGPRSKTATVEPRIASLPKIVGHPHDLRVEDQPLPEDGDFLMVLTFLLEGLHRFYYTYEAYRAISQSATRMPTLGVVSSGSASMLNQTSSKPDAVFRSFLGLAPQEKTVQHVPSIHDVLGPHSSADRGTLMAEVEQRMGKHFSAAQRRFFIEWEMRTASLDCVPGAGKTTLLAGVAVAVALRPNARVNMIVTEPNKVMAATVFDVYRELMGDRLVARVGLNDASGHRGIFGGKSRPGY